MCKYKTLMYNFKQCCIKYFFFPSSLSPTPFRITCFFATLVIEGSTWSAVTRHFPECQKVILKILLMKILSSQSFLILNDKKLLSMQIVFTLVNSMISIVSKPILYFSLRFFFLRVRKDVWSVDQMCSLLASFFKVKFYEGG